MNILYFIIFVFVLSIIFIYDICFSLACGNDVSKCNNNINTSNSKLYDFEMYKYLNHYYIYDNSFINGVFFKKSISQVLLHGFSPLLNINISDCELIYRSESVKCIANFSKYFGLMDSYFFDLKIDTNIAEKPNFVKINNISIDIPEPIHSRYKYVICSRLLVNFTRANYLVQHFEALKLFGATKVVSYFTSATPDVLKVLEYYVNDGILDLYKYDEEVDIAWKGRYYGEVSKLNHCFHQYQEIAEHIMECDYDEILWPVMGNNYDDMMKILPKFDIYYTHTRLFPVSFVVVKQEDDRRIPLKDLNMFSINTSCQTYNGFAHKYIIASPMKVSAVEIHHIPIHLNLTETWIDPNIAYLRHTRHMVKGMAELCKVFGKTEKNETMKRIERIADSVKRKIGITLIL